MILSIDENLNLEDSYERKFLTLAVNLSTINTDAFKESKIPLYHLIAFIKKLENAGEIENETWNENAKIAYSKKLAEKPSAKTNESTASLEEDMPREKSMRNGIKSLGHNELLALFLRTGGKDEDVLQLANRLLQKFDGLSGIASVDISELLLEKSIGPAKATELAAAFEIGKRLARSGSGIKPSLKSPESVVEFIGPAIGTLQHEELWCILLDNSCRHIRDFVVSTGDVNETSINPRMIFRNAILHKAVSCIVVHNHPTKDSTASQQDIIATKNLIEAGNLLNIKLHDHIIIASPNDYTSIRRIHPEIF